jgi:hypothetical protein
MDVKNRNTLITALSVCAVVLFVLLACIRFIVFVDRRAKNRPEEPVRELPEIYGRWEKAQGYIVFTRTDGRDIEGRRT